MASRQSTCPLPAISAIQPIVRAYRKRWRIQLLMADRAGMIVWPGRVPTVMRLQAAQKTRAFAIEESLRWGEPAVTMVPDGKAMLWAVPLMTNAKVTGGLIAHCSESRMLPDDAEEIAFDTRAACSHLRELAEHHNLTNAAFLETRRHEYQREQKRAEAIHTFKKMSHLNLRSLYLVDEPELIAALRRGDRPHAREILNRLLAAVMHHGGENAQLIKSFFMELTATLCRTAVEAGGSPEELLGANYASVVELSKMGNLEQLSHWLHLMLERMLDSIARNRSKTPTLLLAGAMEYITVNCHRGITRADAAKAAHLSPSYFSRLFKRELGHGFSYVLNQKRVERAADELVRTAKSLKVIAMECGFADQAYFTKVFAKHTGKTPMQYRRQLTEGPAGRTE